MSETVPSGRHIIFLSTLSLRRATLSYSEVIAEIRFLSTLSLRRATGALDGASEITLHFYPRSPCGERHAHHFSALHDIFISIHALLAESDLENALKPSIILYFYPRSPCGERLIELQCILGGKYFYPRSPCGERPGRITSNGTKKLNFYPRSPCGERLSLLCINCMTLTHFYPRSPCGERLKISFLFRPPQKFLSTLSLRRATAKVHKTVGHFCAYGTNFMGIASSC